MYNISTLLNTRTPPSDVIPDMAEPSTDVETFTSDTNCTDGEQCVGISMDEVEAGTPLEERLLVDQDLYYREPKPLMKTYSRRRTSPHIVIERCSPAEKMLKEQSIPLKEITQTRKRRSSRHSLPVGGIESPKRARNSDGSINDENNRTTRSITLRSRSCSLGNLETKESQLDDEDKTVANISKESLIDFSVNLHVIKTTETEESVVDKVEEEEKPEIFPTVPIQADSPCPEKMEEVEEVLEKKPPRRSLRVQPNCQKPEVEPKQVVQKLSAQLLSSGDVKPPHTPKGRELRTRSCNTTPKTYEEDCSSSVALDSTLDMSSYIDSDSDYDFENDIAADEEEYGADSLFEKDDDDDSVSWDGEFELVPNILELPVLWDVKSPKFH
ncbi:Hypothetical predicted protein [Cloeon dipterum]|uniref:Uncharacterized protein n=1 Tax=Cloeon dipterum TaxID=197152 RepID=A0A8S1D2S6_9INSE|nr:Hypothetical predicted protein [Cloeon dipterum]